MKSLLLLLGLFLCAGSSQPFFERTKLALKSGNSQKLLALMASQPELSFDGEGSRVSRQDAGAILSRFFRENPPADFTLLYQGQSRDYRQFMVGTLKTRSASYRVTVYWIAQPREEILSIDFSGG